MKGAVPVLALALLGSATPAPSGAGSFVTEAAAALLAERHGITAFHRHYAFEEHGPGHNKSTVVDSIVVRDAGKVVAVRLLSQLDNGNAESPNDLAKAQTELDKQPQTDDYVLPLTESALAQYTFAFATGSCEASCHGPVTIAFTSVIRDPSHGDGTLVVDEPSHHVVSLEFHPSALPAHADSGTISMRFGQVLPDLWDLVETKEHYTGHMLFIHGWGGSETSDTAYGRFPSVEAATR